MAGPAPASESAAQSAATSQRVLYVARTLAVAVVALAAFRYAWLSDDALITARSALNALHGYGPDFNIDERVMAYTHPLWFVQMLFVGWISGDVIVAPLLVSVVLAAVGWLVVVTAVVSVARIALGTVALLLSNSALEYAASGLENPLAYALLAASIVLGRRCLGSSSTTGRAAIGLGLLAAGVLLTRLDLVLVVAPALALVAWGLRRQRRALALMFGAALLPLVAWAVFAYSYYGYLLPSTLAAKTNTAIPRAELLFTGTNYFLVTFTYDPVALVVLLTGAACAVFAADAYARAWLLGVAIYLAYVVWIGGDFMAGRFVAVPVFVVLATLLTAATGTYVALMPQVDAMALARNSAVVGIAVLVVLGLGRSDVLTPNLPDAPRWDLSRAGGVADERGFYQFKGRGLMQYLGSPRATSTEFVDLAAIPEGWQPNLAQLRVNARAWPSAVETERVEVKCGGLGEASIVSGPQVHWIDPCGLADLFLAGIPYRSQDFAWRIGHFDRPLPEGYLDAVSQADPTLVVDPELRWDLERIWERVRP